MCGKSLIDQVADERSEKARAESRRPEYQSKADFWRQKGYITARLLKAMQGDMRICDQTFGEFERDVRRLGEAQVKLNAMDFKGFPDDVLAIRQKLSDPDAVGEVEAKLAELEGKIKARREDDARKASEAAKLEKEKKLGLYRQRIQSWADKGYATKRLEGLLEDPNNDSISIEKQLGLFDADIAKLLELRRKLESIDTSGNEDDVKVIDKLLFDPDAIEEAGDRVALLAREFYKRKTEADRRVEMRKRLEEYRAKGYKVARIEGAPDKPMDEAEALFQTYEEDVGVLFRLWDRLRAVDKATAPETWEAARAIMNDPDKVSEVEKIVTELEGKFKGVLAARAEEDKKLAAGVKDLMKEIFVKMKETVPDYMPSGLFIRDGKWEPQMSPDGLSVKGLVHYGIFNKECIIVSAAYSVPPARQALVTEAESARGAELFVARCYVTTRAAPEMVPMFKTFKHPSMSLFLYDLSASSVICNEDDLKTKVYSEWFQKGVKPAMMHGAIKLVADKHGIFTRAVLTERLGLQPKEMDEMLKLWLEKNEVIVVSKIKDEYSFMD